MSGRVWRAVFGVLRADRFLLLFVLLPLSQTDYWVMQALRHGARPTILAAGWFVFAVAWPLTLSLLPSYRQMLQLPLSAREAGAVLLIIRVALPSLCLVLDVLFRHAIDAAIAMSGPKPGLPLADPVGLLRIMLSLCAAFPAMILVPFLPLPATDWRTENGYPLFGQGRLPTRIAAATTTWIVGPLVAGMSVVPFQQPNAGNALLSALFGSVILLLGWRFRGWLALESLKSNSLARMQASRFHLRGWPIFGLLLVPGLICVVAFGAATAFLAARLAQPEIVAWCLAILSGFLAFAVFLPLQDCFHALRLLPIRLEVLSAVLLVALVLPPFAGLLICLAIAFSIGIPDWGRLAESVPLWFFCISWNAAYTTFLIRFSRRRVIALLWLPSSAAQWYVFTLVTGGAGPDGATARLLLMALYLLCISYVGMKFTLRSANLRGVIMA